MEPPPPGSSGCSFLIKTQESVETLSPQMRTMERLPVACLCLLLSCSAVGSAGSRVVVEEDSDVILPCSLSTKEDITLELFVWKKDDQKYVFFSNAGSTAPDKQFEGRVFHFPDELQHGNASIIIRKTKVADSGKYTCIFPNLQPEQPSHIELVVGAAPEPSVTSLEETDNWSLLQCKVKGAFPKPKVEWRDSSGNILPAEEPLVSERGGSFYIILNTTVTKSDTYYCVSTQKEINHQTHAKIRVHISAPELSVKIVGPTEDGVLLQCEVQGASPKPKVEWRDSSGNILPAKEPQVTERRGSFDIILQVIVTKTDHYRCVATQKEINHQTEADTYVPVNESSSGWVVAVVVTFFVTVLLGVVLLLALRHMKRHRKQKSNNSSTSASQPAAGEEVALNGSSSKEATEP